MDVTCRFKQSDIGPIPEDWELSRVGESFEVCDHLRLPISRAVRGQMIGPYPYYGPTSIQGWINEFRLDGLYALIGEDGDHFLKWRSQPMTLLVQGKFNVNNHAHVIRGTKNKTEWFYWFFANRDITSALTRQGAGRYKLTKTALLQLVCAIPSLTEQEAINEIFSDAHSLVDSLEKILAKKRGILKGTRQALLTGAVRLPGFSARWTERRIAEIAVPNTELNRTRRDLPVLTCSKHLGFVDSLRYFRNQVFSSDTSGYKVIYRGEIGYPANHVEEGSIGLQDLYEVALVSPIYVVFRPLRNVSPYFLHRLLKTDAYRQRFENATTASVDRRGSLRWPAFSRISVSLPELEEQTAIAQVLSDMDSEIATLEQKLAKARALKRGMMHELLTGRIRLI